MKTTVIIKVEVEFEHAEGTLVTDLAAFCSDLETEITCMDDQEVVGMGWSSTGENWIDVPINSKYADQMRKDKARYQEKVLREDGGDVDGTK